MLPLNFTQRKLHFCSDKPRINPLEKKYVNASKFRALIINMENVTH